MKDLTSAHGSLAREGGVSQRRGRSCIDSFLEDAIEVDVDAVRDMAGDVFIAGVMEHVEEAGVHSGDSACALPPQTLSENVLATLRRLHDARSPHALEVVGSHQRAVRGEGRRGLRARGQSPGQPHGPVRRQGDRRGPRPGGGARDDGQTLADLRGWGSCPRRRRCPSYVSVKEAVLPFSRFPGVDTVLGPEMRSTGEVMGIGESFGIAFAKSQLAAGTRLPDSGQVFMSPRRSRQGRRARPRAAA